MTMLLLVIAIVATFALVGSSLSSLKRVTATDTRGRGGWGVLDWSWKRTRRLDAHERRWQTALISGSDQATRWPDMVAEITRLERAADVDSDPAPPDSYDANWIEARLDRIDQTLDDHD